MIRINLLPHREEKKKQRRREFAVMMVLAAFAGGLIVILVGQFIDGLISAQNGRNTFIEAENKKLDEQIKEIASLKQEIDQLKARQQAVEDLQSDRNLPTLMLDDLVRFTPEGIYLRGIKQDGLKVNLTGLAQSNERVSEFLRNLSGATQWINSPELIEIKTQVANSGPVSRSKLFEFSLNVNLKRPGAKPAADGKPPQDGAKPAAPTAPKSAS